LVLPSNSNQSFSVIQDIAAFKVLEAELEPNSNVSTTQENMIFQSCYKEITQAKSSKLHGHGYLAKYPTRKELFKDNIEVQKCAEAAAR